MDIKEMIIKLLSKCDEQTLKLVYHFIKSLLK
jgi:hypothetical protein